MEVARGLKVHVDFPLKYFVIVLALGVTLLAAFLDPDQLQAVLREDSESSRQTTTSSQLHRLWQQPPVSLERAPKLLFSPLFLGCAVPAVIGLGKILTSRTIPDGERFVVIWWWLNLTFFLTVCDMFSGFLNLMPNLSELYLLLNRDHLRPRWHPDRIVLDTVYSFEIGVQIPVLVYTMLLHFRRSPQRYLWNVGLCGLQVGGAVAYYVPDIILGKYTTVITNLDRGIAFSWVLMSVAICRWAGRGLAAAVGDDGNKVLKKGS